MDYSAWRGGDQVLRAPASPWLSLGCFPCFAVLPFKYVLLDCFLDCFGCRLHGALRLRLGPLFSNQDAVEHPARLEVQGFTKVVGGVSPGGTHHAWFQERQRLQELVKGILKPWGPSWSLKWTTTFLSLFFWEFLGVFGAWNVSFSRCQNGSP